MFENDNQYPNDVNYNSNSAAAENERAENDNHYNDYSHYYGSPHSRTETGRNLYAGTETGTGTNAYTAANAYTGANAETGTSAYTDAGRNTAADAYTGSAAHTNQSAYADHASGYDGYGSSAQNAGSTAASDTAYGRQEWDGSYRGASAYTASDIKEKEKKAKKSGSGFGKRVLKLAGSGLVFGAFAGIVIAGILVLSPVRVSENTGTDSTGQTAVQKAERIEQSKLVETNSTITSAAVVTDVSDVVEEVMPSVVSITGIYKVESYNPFGGYFGFGMEPEEQEEEGSGSGIIVGKNDEELLIATNNHVVEDATSLSVQFIDGENVDAQVKGTESDVDLAVIAVPLSSIKDTTFSQIKIANLGDSDALKVGEPAIAIGNALGYGQSVTTGVISAVNREYTQDGTTNYLIQTDAAINPGNSGGALMNIRGEVVGINSNKIAGSAVEGMGYAIPISTAKPIIEELMTKQTRVRVDDQEQKAFLGISGINVTEEVSSTYGLPEGIYIAQVYENTAAAKAGLTKGDILVEFDGEKVETLEELTSLLEYYKKGTTVDIVIMQGSPSGYQEKTITVTLGGRTDS
ncbi:MAG: trypsin-like peptidase domain-containing protein [Lachnospiraceae bacterium]|nr:trypsin-like peptidase domain-containing protein [Lachnospiraceae bacterium]